MNENKEISAMHRDEDENPPYTPAEILDYYEEVLRETLDRLEKVQWENSRSIAALPNAKEICVFEQEDRASTEVCLREISAIIYNAKSSLQRKLITSINKRKTCEKFDRFCKNYWGGEKDE